MGSGISMVINIVKWLYIITVKIKHETSGGVNKYVNSKQTT